MDWEKSSQKKLMPFKINMLGPSGVGKTSLLTVMQRQMNAVVDISQLQLNPGNPQIPGSDFETMAFFLECEVELTQQIKSRGWLVKGGIQGSSVDKTFSFHVSKPQHPSFLPLEFQDYPGGWIESKDFFPVQKQQQPREFRASQVVDYIKNSHVTILVIDTPALIEKKGKYHVEINKSEIVKELLLKAYREDESGKPKLLMLAPVKCEKYFQGTHNEYRKIEQNICSQYKDLLHSLKAPDFKDVAAVISPIKIMGNVLFAYIEENIENNTIKPRFYYHKTNKHELEPVDAEQPLRYILQFMLKNYIDDNFLTLDEDLKIAINQYAAGCKRDGGFVVLQGEHLL